MNRISYFKSAKTVVPTGDMDILEFFEDVKDGKWQDIVLNYRAGKVKEKASVPAVTVSGLFEKRKVSGLKKHSGILNIDIDAKDNPDIDLAEYRAEFFTDPFILGGNLSLSGKGLSCYVRINPKKHLDSFLAIEKYFANNYHIIIDKSAKDVSRMRFVSYDPDMYINTKAEKWTEYLPKEKKQPVKFNKYISTNDDFEYVMKQIVDRQIDLTSDYGDWITLGFAIATEHGDAGRQYFHDLSRPYPNYNQKKTDAKYTSMLRSNSSGRVSIGSFYWMAQNAGCQIKTAKTKQVEQVFKMNLKSVGKNGGLASKEVAEQTAKEYLKTMNGIEGSLVDEIGKQVANLTKFEIEKEEFDDLEVIMHFVNKNKLEYNEVTGTLEIAGEGVTDKKMNDIYIDILEVAPKMPKSFYDIVTNSDRIPAYNPFKRFIEKNRHLRPKGQIERAIGVIKERINVDENPYDDWKNIFVRKWMLSIMASIHGTYSLMILVLTGKQGTGKTNWFRYLLPDELSMYYAESKLDLGKDDEILMTKKAIIVDDEFGGKSKIEAKKLKDLSSKQWFSVRRPYGRVSEDMLRIAVLGGTSNDDEVLNDPTGNRRIIPLHVTNIDIEQFKRIDKTELFMEMYYEWKRIGEGWMLTSEEVKMLNNTTKRHELVVMEHELIQKYYEVDDTYYHKVTSTDVKVTLDFLTGQNLTINKIGAMLRMLGYKQVIKRDGNKVKRMWNVQRNEVMSASAMG